MQELLDIYLYLTSNLPEVKNLIGFQPENIILLGDSAGAVLILSLTLILNDIRNRINVKMPSKLIAIYPVITLSSRLSPSRLFAFFDILLPIIIFTIPFNAYIRDDDDDEDNNKDVTNKSWLLKESSMKREKFFDEIATDPYISPYYYESFDTLTDVPLHLIVGEFDPFLDDTIVLSKKWKGKVKFDLVDN